MIDLIFGAAGVNVVTKDKVRFFVFGLGFNDALLFSNLISVTVFFIGVF
mgnify:CR=1 FL=1